MIKRKKKKSKGSITESSKRRGKKNKAASFSVNLYNFRKNIKAAYSKVALEVDVYKDKIIPFWGWG